MKSIWNLWLNENYNLISFYALKYAISKCRLSKDITRLIKKDFISSLIAYIEFKYKFLIDNFYDTKVLNYDYLYDFTLQGTRIVGVESADRMGDLIEVYLVKPDIIEPIRMVLTFSIDIVDGEKCYQLINNNKFL